MSHERETARFFTRARRIPLLIGKLPDGSSVPFGPFKVAQVLGAAAAVFVLTRTTQLWAHFGVFGNLLAAAVIVIGVVMVIGKLPSTGRNPMSYGADLLSLVNGPKTGKLHGRPLRVSRPHRVTHRVIAQLPVPAHSAPQPELGGPDGAPTLAAAPTTPDAPSPGQGPGARPVAAGQLTGVARLLAQATAAGPTEESHDA